MWPIALAIGAWARRSGIPDEDRFVVDFGAFFRSIGLLKSADTKIDRIMTVRLIISILLAIAVTVYVIAVPKGGEKFMEFYVLGPGGKAEEYLINLTLSE